jgi:hypothetical protein
LKKTELAIGDSTELEISYFTGAALTLETKTVTVSSSDTVSGFNRLDITADVNPKPDTLLDISYAPYSLEFKEKKKGKFEEMKVEFRNKGKEEYKLQVIDYPKGFFEAKLSDEILRSGKVIELKVKPVKKFPPDTVKKSITIGVVGKKEFRVTIPLKREKAPGMALPPVKGK